MATVFSVPYGPDVASHQGAVDWPAVASDGYLFAATKATGGAWYTNPTFKANWNGIKAAGMTRMAYHYAFESSGQAYPGPGPEAEADFFLAHVEPLGLDTGDILVLDIEEGPGDVDLADWSLRWLQRVKSRVGFAPIVYTGAWFADPHGFGSRPELGEYGLWLAAYTQSMPPPPAPWMLVAFWQFTDQGQVSGIASHCDVNLFNGTTEAMAIYGKPQSGPGPTYAYNWQYPAVLQEESFDCSQTALLWALRSWGLDVDEGWLESTMIVEGIMTPEQGCMDASGAGIAAFVNAHWGEQGFQATNSSEISFDEAAAETAQHLYPAISGGRSWYHWTGNPDFDAGNDQLLLANPAPGWQGIYQSMSRSQFQQLGSFSFVRIRNPEAEAGADGGNGGNGGTMPDYTPWEGRVGSGLLELMAQDGTKPAQRASTWLPLGVSPADVESCYGQNGTLYVWLLAIGRGFRYKPS